MARRQLVVAFVSLVLAALFWAGNYVVGEAAVGSIDPLSLVLLRWIIAAVPLLVIAQLVERPHWQQLLAAWPWLLGLSLFGLLGYNLLLYSAVEHTTAFNASLINAFNPALITLAAVAFLGAKLTVRAAIGILVALVGVLIVLTGGSIGGMFETGFGTGELLMLGAVGAWTAYTILGRIAPPLPPITATAVQAVITVGVLAPISFATGGPHLPASAGSAWALAYIGVFPSILSYLLWNRALTVIPPARAGVFLNLITVFTALITIAIGGPATAAQFIGGAIVIGGVILANAAPRRDPPSVHRRVPPRA